MGVTTTRNSPDVQAPTAQQVALAVADANWFTTENLFREAPGARARTLLLNCIDYNNALRRGLPPWAWGRPLRQSGPAQWRRDLVLPSGWMKKFPRLGMRPIARSILRWRAEHAPVGRFALVMTYPHYLYLRDQVRPDRQVYFNVDDYAQYWPRHAREIERLERQAVREADLTVCVSRLRAEQLREAVPEAAARIRHLPHGAPTSSLTPTPLDRPDGPPAAIAHLPRPLLGFVGSLGDRVDWSLLAGLAQSEPTGSVVLVGRIDGERPGAWEADRERCLALGNVHHVPWLPQEAIAAYNRAFDVCLIPYLVDHPFNRVSCPTKIMDYMATGRPVVTTALPECRLYHHLFDVAETPGEFVAAVRSLVARGSDDGRSAERHAFAEANSCRRVVERLLDWLP
ncbi:MAG TPA: glycosyltransferase [Isosphaeraceae bacterium]|jgi:glycosyltransferase involved in cell wall biosynthesis